MEAQGCWVCKQYIGRWASASLPHQERDGRGLHLRPLKSPGRAGGMGSASILTCSMIWDQFLDNCQVAEHGASSTVRGQVVSRLCWVPQVRSKYDCSYQRAPRDREASWDLRVKNLILLFGQLCDLWPIS